MKRTVLTAAMISTLGASAGQATSLYETARIKHIDAKSHKLVLNTGKVYEIPRSMKLSRFKKGDPVRVTFRVSKGHRHVSRVRYIPVSAGLENKPTEESTANTPTM